MRIIDCIVKLPIMCALAALCSQAYAGSAENLPATSGKADAIIQSGIALFMCEGCPPFVAVPSPPPGMRRITHAAVYELTWSQYLPAVEDGSCKFPLAKPDGSPLSAEERRQFDLNWTAGKLRLSDVACFKSWIQRRLPAGYTTDIPTGAEWIWLAKAGASQPKISAQTAVLLESEAILGSYGLLAKPRVPATKPNAVHSCGLVGRMPPNAWGLLDVTGTKRK